MIDSPTIAPKPHLPKDEDKKMFCFGFGYTAQALSETLRLKNWDIVGTTTDSDRADEIKQHHGIKSIVFDTNHTLCSPYETLSDVTHILISIPPNNRGDVVFDLHRDDIGQMKNLEWIGYLSTTGIYGNHDGGSVDENTMPAPDSQRGSHRLLAEKQWMNLAEEYDLPLHIFRLSGIYGPGRSALDSARTGRSRRINKPGHAFNRIHIDDIIQVLIASMNTPDSGAIYNVADDYPAPSEEVIAYACTLLGMDVPKLIPFEQADLAPMVRSFYKDNKRVKNDRIKDDLGVELFHPNYKSGLDACFEAEQELDELVSD